MDTGTNTHGQWDPTLLQTAVRPQNFAGNVTLSRRNCLRFLATCGLIAAGQPTLANSGLSALHAIVTDQPVKSAPVKALANLDRSIALYNTHTRETMRATFFSNGNYDEKELNRLNLFLRDHRENEAIIMDRALFTQMWAIRSLLDTDARFEIVSGYRTPKTNEYLRGKSSGVAQFSYHMLGRAIDLRLREVPSDAVRDAAQQLNAGGVGYYQSSDFVHIDTGEIRHWG